MSLDLSKLEYDPHCWNMALATYDTANKRRRHINLPSLPANLVPILALEAWHTLPADLVALAAVQDAKVAEWERSDK